MRHNVTSLEFALASLFIVLTVITSAYAEETISYAGENLALSEIDKNDKTGELIPYSGLNGQISLTTKEVAIESISELSDSAKNWFLRGNNFTKIDLPEAYGDFGYIKQIKKRRSDRAFSINFEKVANLPGQRDNKDGTLQDLQETRSVVNINTGEKFKSIQAAIDDQNTKDGHELRIESGTYTETLTIDKSLTLEGNGAKILPKSGADHLVKIKADEVTLKGFIFKGENLAAEYGVIANYSNNVDVKYSSIKLVNNRLTDIKNCPIYLDSVTDVTIRNNEIHHNGVVRRQSETDNSNGIFLFNASDFSVLKNEIVDNGLSGIRLINPENFSITDNLVKGNHLSPCGIPLEEAAESKNNECHPAGTGLLVAEKRDTTQAKVNSNTFSENDRGMLIGGSAERDIGSKEVKVSNNSINNNLLHGIHILKSKKVTFERNTVNNNGHFSGITILGGSFNIIRDNEVVGNESSGIAIHGHGRWGETKKNTVEGNQIKRNRTGISLFGKSSENNLNNNNLIENKTGIALSFPIDFSGADGDNFIPAVMVGQNIEGLVKFERKFTGNALTLPSRLYHTIVSKSHPQEFEQEEQVSGITANTLKNNTVKGSNYVGVRLHNCSKNTIDSNKVKNNAFGIIAESSNRSNIIDNEVKYNNSAGITLYSPLMLKDTTTWNLATSIAGGGGVFVSGSENEITDNEVTGNGFGIEIQGGNSPIAAKNNIVKNNVVENNTGGGVTLLVERWEKTSTSSGLNKQSEEPVGSANLSPQAQDWKKTRTIQISQPGSFGLLLANASSTAVAGNTFAGNKHLGIVAGGFSLPEYDLKGQSKNNDFTENEVSNQEVGINLGPYATENTFEDNRVTGNRIGVRSMEATGNVFHGNSIASNKDFGAKNTDNQILDATNNWWGHKSGPYHPDKNPDGQGNKVSDKVKFEPWKKSSSDTHPIPYVLTHWNTEADQLDPDLPCKLSTNQILQAIAWWAEETPVPLTDNKKLSADQVLNLIAMWANGECAG